MTESAPTGSAARHVLEGPWDLAIVGGGINGVGIAHDAARRGKSVVLFEKGDIASGTSGQSSKMLHGGIRYLEQFRLGLVHESLRERGLLLQLAPHLARPQAFLIPIYAGARRGPWMIRAGLFLYDLLALWRGIARGRVLTRTQVVARAPELLAEGLVGGGVYHDAVMDDARLGFAVAQAAIEAARPGNPVEIRSYAEVISLLPGSPSTLQVRDRLTGREMKVSAHRVVRALGPWTEPELLVRSKGAHIVLPHLPMPDGLLLSHAGDGRVFFVIPWQTGAVIGTTETPFEGSPDDVGIDADDVRYLLSEVRRLFPKLGVSASDVRGTFAGVRPLARSPGRRRGAVGSVSRVHRIVRQDDVLTVFGGKYTTFRAVAADVVGRLFPGTTCSTHRAPLPGGEEGDRDSFLARRSSALAELANPDEIERLWARYGCRLEQVLRLSENDPELARPLVPDRPETGAEVVHAIRAELAFYPADVLARRLSLRFTEGRGREAYAAVEELIRRYSPCVPGDLDEARQRYFEELDEEAAILAEVAKGEA